MQNQYDMTEQIKQKNERVVESLAWKPRETVKLLFWKTKTPQKWGNKLEKIYIYI